MKKLISIFVFLFPALLVFSQGIYNNGAHIVINSGTTVYIDGDANGDYTNASGGLIDIDGRLVLEGDFTNNAANNVFTNVDADGEVVFAGTTQSITSPVANYVNFEKVTIESSSTTTLKAASGMTVNGIFTVDGTFTSETPSDETIGGSLITATGTGAVTGSGTININRFFKVNGRWQYVSVPMTNQESDLFTEHTTSGNFNPNFYTHNEAYDEPTDPTNTNYSNYDYGSGYDFWKAWEQVQASAGSPVTLTPAEGYIVYNEGDLNTVFTTGAGNPDRLNHDASYSPTVTFTANDGNSDFYDGWNLIGNPYQSALDWDAAGWTKTNISNTVYMWDGDAGNYVYYNNGSPEDHLAGVGQTINSDASARYIPAMQSFFVKATAASPAFTIPASARVHNDNQMYKAEDIPDFDFVKLQIENTNGQKDQTLVRFIDRVGIKSDFDNDYDAYKMFSTTAGLPQIYSLTYHNSTELPLAINTLPLDYDVEYEVIPLGVVAKEAGDYTFTAVDLNNPFLEKIYLIDERGEHAIYTDLTENPSYTAYIPEGEYRQRFYLLTAKSTTDVESIINTATNVKIYSAGMKMFVALNSDDLTNGTVEVYDAVGRLIFKDKANSTFNEYDMLSFSAGTYIVRYITGSQIYNQTIILK